MLVDRIAEVLQEHWLHHDNRCRCDKSRKVLTGAEWRAHVAERVAAELPEVSETQKLLAVWTEGLVTDKEAYWRLREILRPRETNDDRILAPKVVQR